MVERESSGQMVRGSVRPAGSVELRNAPPVPLHPYCICEHCGRAAGILLSACIAALLETIPSSYEAREDEG